MAAGPSKQQIARGIREANKKASEWNKLHNTIATPRLIRASNGECAIVYDIDSDNGSAVITTLCLPK